MISEVSEFSTWPSPTSKTIAGKLMCQQPCTYHFSKTCPFLRRFRHLFPFSFRLNTSLSKAHMIHLFFFLFFFFILFFIGITLFYNEKRNYTKYYPRLQNKFKRTVSYLSETQRPHSSCKFYKLVKDMF